MTPPEADMDCFSDVPTNFGTLNVPAATAQLYRRAAEWERFAETNVSGIQEFGTTIKVRNAIRYYGDENPSLTYEVVGTPVSGIPELSCKADRMSPVGRYPISVGFGSVDSTEVNLMDGYLVVDKAPLIVKANDTTKVVGQLNPEFTITYSGFKNGETQSVLNELPYVETTAGSQSSEGSYDLVPTGGDADNYELIYENGTLTILGTATDLSHIVIEANKDELFSIDGRNVGQSIGNLRKGLYISSKGRKIVVR